MCRAPALAGLRVPCDVAIAAVGKTVELRMNFHPCASWLMLIF